LAVQQCGRSRTERSRAEVASVIRRFVDLLEYRDKQAWLWTSKMRASTFNRRIQDMRNFLFDRASPPFSFAVPGYLASARHSPRNGAAHTTDFATPVEGTENI